MSTASPQTASFDIRNFQDQLEPAKKKNKHICPVCGGNDLSIIPETGKYRCFNNCECKDVREALKPWAEVLAERKGANHTPSPRKNSHQPKKVKPKPAPIPADFTLATLPKPAIAIPTPQELMIRPPNSIPWNAKQTVHAYSDSQYVTRFEWADASKEKGYDKTFRQWHRLPDGTPEMKKGDFPWGAYRIEEAIAAAKLVNGTPALLQHEGEGCVEVGRSHGLAGITFQGSGWDRETITREYQRAKDGGVGIIVFLHDPDGAGLKKLQTCSDCAAEVGIAFIGISPNSICPDLPYKSSDIKEILGQMEVPEFILRLEREIHAAINQRSQQAELEVIVVDTVADDPNRVKKTPDATVLNSLFENGNGNYRVINDAYFQYSNKGYWQYIHDAKINKWISQKLLEIYQLKTSGDKPVKEFKYANDRNKTSAFKFCRSVMTVEEEPSNEHLLCFLNGTTDLRTGEILPHSREHFLTYAIGTNYVPNAECPEVFKSFIFNAFGEEFLPLIRAITSMYLDPTAPFGYFAHIIGSSGSGKGTLLRLWGSMFGENNLRSLTSFGDITTAEGRHQYLTGAKFVSFPDMGGYQGSLKAFYELVDNGSMTGRALYSSSSYERRWKCRFALASVSYLSIENSGDGWDRRAIPVPTRQRQGAIDPDLGRKLQEVKGEIISWALGMNRQERDCLIMNASAASDRIASLKREQSIYSDSTKAFVDLCLRPTSTPGAFVENHKLYDWYCAFCKSHGFKAQSSTKFISHLRSVLPINHIPRKQYRDGGTVKNVPAHFAYLTQINGAFTSTNILNETLWQCSKAFCTDGGLDAFDKFWLSVTAVTATDNQPCDMAVTAESLTNIVFERLSQVSQVSQGEKLVAQIHGQQTDKIGSSEQLEMDIRVNSPDLSCDTCDSRINIDTASIPAVTAKKFEPCDDPVTAVTAVTANPKDSTPEPQPAIAIEDPYNDNYEPKVGDEVVVINGLIANSIGERHTIAVVLSNKGIQVRYMAKNAAGKKEEKAASIGRDDYTPAMKRAT